MPASYCSRITANACIKDSSRIPCTCETSGTISCRLAFDNAEVTNYPTLGLVYTSIPIMIHE